MSLQTNTQTRGRVHRLRAFDNGTGTYTLLDTQTATLYEWQGGPYVDVFPSGVDDQYPVHPAGTRPRPSDVIDVWDRSAGAPCIERDVLVLRDYVEAWLARQEAAAASQPC
jgi:hypothetical protein